MPEARPRPAGWGPMGLPLGLVERRINTLATGWLVYAALIAITGFAGLAFAHAFMGPHMGPFWSGPNRFGHHYWIGPGLPFFWLRFAWMGVALRTGLALAAGLGLMQKTTWGRWVAIVAGCIMLIHMPLGTAMGIWTLVVLLNAPNALGYEVMSRG